MPETSDLKTDRLQMRLDMQSKNVLQRAANYQHKSLSQFVLGTALEEANRVIRDHEVMTLSDTDWKLFFDVLADPPAPNTALREAFSKYRRTAT